LDQARIENRHYSLVGALADQPAESLTQLNDRPRYLVMLEGIDRPLFHILNARFRQRLGRNVERQFGDDNARQRVAGNIHPLPERIGAKYNGRFFLEALEHPAGSQVALLQYLVLVELGIEHLIHAVENVITGE